jgi:hypothetical protein
VIIDTRVVSFKGKGQQAERNDQCKKMSLGKGQRVVVGHHQLSLLKRQRQKKKQRIKGGIYIWLRLFLFFFHTGMVDLPGAKKK